MKTIVGATEAVVLYRRKYPKKFEPRAFTAELVKDAVRNTIDVFAAAKIGFHETPRTFQIVFGPEEVERLDEVSGKALKPEPKPSYYWVRISMFVLGEQPVIPQRLKRGSNGLVRHRWI